MKIQKIFLSSEDRKEYFLEVEEGQTDVIVVLDTEEKFTASFFSFTRLTELKRLHKCSSEFNFGSYFWAKNLILVDDCEKKTIEKVIKNLMEEGDFVNAFRKLI